MADNIFGSWRLPGGSGLVAGLNRALQAYLGTRSAMLEQERNRPVEVEIPGLGPVQLPAYQAAQLGLQIAQQPEMTEITIPGLGTLSLPAYQAAQLGIQMAQNPSITVGEEEPGFAPFLRGTTVPTSQLDDLARAGLYQPSVQPVMTLSEAVSGLPGFAGMDLGKAGAIEVDEDTYWQQVWPALMEGRNRIPVDILKDAATVSTLRARGIEWLTPATLPAVQRVIAESNRYLTDRDRLAQNARALSIRESQAGLQEHQIEPTLWESIQQGTAIDTGRLTSLTTSWVQPGPEHEDDFQAELTRAVSDLAARVQAGQLTNDQARLEWESRVNGWNRQYSIARDVAVTQARLDVSRRELDLRAQQLGISEKRLEQLIADSSNDYTLARMRLELEAEGHPDDVDRWLADYTTTLGLSDDQAKSKLAADLYRAVLEQERDSVRAQLAALPAGAGGREALQARLQMLDTRIQQAAAISERLVPVEISARDQAIVDSLDRYFGGDPSQARLAWQEEGRQYRDSLTTLRLWPVSYQYWLEHLGEGDYLQLSQRYTEQLKTQGIEAPDPFAPSSLQDQLDIWEAVSSFVADLTSGGDISPQDAATMSSLIQSRAIDRLPESIRDPLLASLQRSIMTRGQLLEQEYPELYQMLIRALGGLGGGQSNVSLQLEAPPVASERAPVTPSGGGSAVTPTPPSQPSPAPSSAPSPPLPATAPVPPATPPQQPPAPAQPQPPARAVGLSQVPDNVEGYLSIHGDPGRTRQALERAAFPEVVKAQMLADLDAYIAHLRAIAEAEVADTGSIAAAIQAIESAPPEVIARYELGEDVKASHVIWMLRQMQGEGM